MLRISHSLGGSGDGPKFSCIYVSYTIGFALKFSSRSDPAYHNAHMDIHETHILIIDCADQKIFCISLVMFIQKQSRETDERCSVDAPCICTKAQQRKYGPLLSDKIQACQGTGL